MSSTSHLGDKDVRWFLMGAYGSSHAPRVNLGGTRVCWSICDLQKRNDIHRHTAGSRGFCWFNHQSVMMIATIPSHTLVASHRFALGRFLRSPFHLFRHTFLFRFPIRTLSKSLGNRSDICLINIQKKQVPDGRKGQDEFDKNICSWFLANWSVLHIAGGAAILPFQYDLVCSSTGLLGNFPDHQKHSEAYFVAVFVLLVLEVLGCPQRLGFAFHLSDLFTSQHRILSSFVNYVSATFVPNIVV